VAGPGGDDRGLERAQLGGRGAKEPGELVRLERAVQELAGRVRREVGPSLALVEQHDQGAVVAVADLLVAEPTGLGLAVEDDGGHRRRRPVRQLGRRAEVGDSVAVGEEAAGD
jgi:hypothetical protein